MKYYKKMIKESPIEEILIDYVEFFMYSVPNEIYEEVRTALLEKGLFLIKRYSVHHLKPRLYRILNNLKIDKMRNYYSNKNRYKQNYYIDGVTIPGNTDTELDRIDTYNKYREQMEVLYTAIRRMKPTQKRLIREFFKVHNKRDNYFKHLVFKVPIKQVIKQTGTNRRRGFKLLDEIRAILKQVILERKKNNSYDIPEKVQTFEELWDKIKGGEIIDL